jgi:hypothetical protein
MWYNIDIQKLTLQLLPTFLRGKAVLQSLFLAISQPVVFIYDQWNAKRLQDLYKIEHTGQVCLLRKALNDRFDPTLRRIEIVDGNRIIRQYIYTTVEQQPRFLSSPMFIYSRDDYADTGVDFVVIAPQDIIDQNPFEMNALIDFYKQDVKRYKIIA